jgi:Family of unknown function (DUF5923)
MPWTSPPPSAVALPDKAKEDGQQGTCAFVFPMIAPPRAAAAHHLRTLFVSNGDAGKLVSDLQVVGRDLLARSADFIPPSNEELCRVDPDTPPSKEQEGTSKGWEGANGGGAGAGKGDGGNCRRACRP